MEDLLLSSREVAKVLRVHRDTLKKWRRKGEGPPWLQKGHRIAYKKSEVDRWLSEQATAPSPTTRPGLPIIPPAPPPPAPRAPKE